MFTHLSQKIVGFSVLMGCLAFFNTAQATVLDGVLIDCYHKGVDGAHTKDIVQVDYYDLNGKLLQYKCSWWATGKGVTGAFATKRDEKRYPPCNSTFDAKIGKVTNEEMNVGSVQVRIAGGDALWIDELKLLKHWDLKHHFGRNGGKGYCLSTEANDSGGSWRQYVDGDCKPCFEFKTSNNKVYGCSKPNPNPGFVKTDGTGNSVSNESTSFATGKRATQSSTGWGGDAGRAIDGNTNQNYSANSTSHTADGDNMPWWEVDLGRVYAISGVEIFNRTDCCTDRLRGAKVILSETPLPKDASIKNVIDNLEQGGKYSITFPHRVLPLQPIAHQKVYVAEVYRQNLKGLEGGMKNPPMTTHTNARYVRVQLPGPGLLHLSEVRVF